MEIRDGNDVLNGSPDYRGIPFYQRKMNEFVRVFARTFNEGVIDIDGDGILDKVDGHVNGYRLNSAEGDPEAGIRFFTMLDKNGKPVDSVTFASYAGGVIDDPDTTGVNEYLDAMYSQITAKNFSVSSEIYEDPSNNIAVSGSAGRLEILKTCDQYLACAIINICLWKAGLRIILKTVIFHYGS